MQNVQLSSIVSKKAFPLKSDDSIYDALTLMTENQISSVVIVDNDNKPIGIFTEHDSLKIASNFINTSNKISDVMTKKIFTIRDDININDAYIEMDKEGFNHLVVVDKQGSYLGVVTQGDFLRNATFKQINLFKSVSDISISVPLTVEATALIKDVAKIMEERNFNFAIITEDNKPKALITQRDISRCLTEVSLNELSSRSISTLQTQRFHFLNKSSSIREAIVLMESAGVHQLIIVDDKDELIGIISRHDLLEALYGSYFKHLINTIEMKNLTLIELQKSQTALNTQTAFLNNIINTIPDLIWIKDLDGKYLTCNRLFENYFGIEKENIIGKADYDFVDKKLPVYLHDYDKKTMESEEYLVFADGSHSGLYKIRQTPMLSNDNIIIGTLYIAHDITEQREKEKELKKLANYDFLTEIPNRSLLKYHLKKAITNAKSNDSYIALIIFDLDKFKNINDSYGHTVGDELLVAVANRLSTTLSTEDLIARMGGDEFALLLDNMTNIEDAAHTAKKMIEIISKPYILNGLEIHIGTSAGIAVSPKDADSVETIIQYADSALYKAKNEGRGKYRYYNDNMTQDALKYLDYENRLHKALHNCELEVYYQPQVDMQTDKIIGAEALLRWICPTEGLILPTLFIPIAEETGLIAAIGEWVLNQTCKDGKRWLDLGYDLTLAVNVSSHQLKYQNIPKLVDDAIQNSGFKYENLELELTESAIINREAEIIEMLNILKDKGIQLAIDDFGTGYSSLSYLKLFPIDVLKIDKSFVDDILYQDDSQAIIVAIIEMAKALGYKVLAEGTEYIEQIEFLKEKGCNIYQGYYKSVPLPAAQFEKLLKAEYDSVNNLY
ncbi:EAL domain-containing protein [bacterium]|nr:EAL domain-containing protein [bacterium]MBU1884435.1 EAL domain-containing protein [bacterium]